MPSDEKIQESWMWRAMLLLWKSLTSRKTRKRRLACCNMAYSRGGFRRTDGSNIKQPKISGCWQMVHHGVTIVHWNTINIEPELWDRCTAPHEMSTTSPPLFTMSYGMDKWWRLRWKILLLTFLLEVTKVVSLFQTCHSRVTSHGVYEQQEDYTCGNEGDGRRSRNGRKPTKRRERKFIRDDNLTVYGRIKGLMKY